MCIKAIRFNLKWAFLLIICVTIGIATYCKIENSKKEQIEELPKQVEQMQVQEEQKNMAAPKIVQIEKVLQIPEKYDGYDVIAKLEIPKIELTTYVIAETTEETLAVSVTKLCGPDVNKPGNFCITRS